jgi:two-component system cell cycle sensor histidine kinase/response regulator CckA
MLRSGMQGDGGQSRDELVAAYERTRSELSESQQLTERMLEAMPGGIVHVGIDGAVKMANAEALRILGMRYDEATKRHVQDWDPETLWEDGSPCPMEDYPVAKALTTGEPQPRATIGIRRPDGAVSWAVFTALPMKNAAGEVTGAVVTFLDITERKRAEEEREQLQGQLAEAQRLEAIGRLAGGLAHDFNNLLTIIQGSTDLLRRKLDGSAHLTTVNHIGTATETATQLTRQLLAFGRQQTFESRNIDLNTLLDGTMEMMRRVVREDIETIVEPCSEPARMRADPVQLERVLINLATNARDAMPEGGKLSFRTAIVDVAEGQMLNVRAGRYVTLDIADSGTGMDAATQERIFEPFFTTKSMAEGTGLGLASVHGIVTQGGGHITVESELGAGTTFRILFPHIDGQPSVSTTTPAIVEATPASGTILLVEDNIFVRNVTRQILEAAGYRVLSASGGHEVLEALANKLGEIDLLVSDVVMPGLSGPKLAENLLEKEPRLRVLFVSGYDEEQIRIKGLSPNEIGFLAKPYSAEALTARVRHILES